MSEDGLADSAILMLSLGEEEASEIFRHLSPKEVQKLGEAMARMKGVTRERVGDVVQRFNEAADGQSSIGSNADAYLRTTLTRALGAEKAGFVLDRILQASDNAGIEGLKWMAPAAVAELVKAEHPQVIAAVLAHLERDQAAEILGYLPERMRSDVVLRVATLDGIQPAALKELNDVIATSLSGSGSDRTKRSTLGGIRAAAEIVNFPPRPRCSRP
jgi:flagellar motor switch protein FliG